MVALAENREGKRTLRTHAIEYKPAPKVTPQELVQVKYANCPWMISIGNRRSYGYGDRRFRSNVTALSDGT